MNIELFDSPPQPRDQVKIVRLDVQPYPDGWRVKINVDVTPFQERPNLEIFVRNTAGKLIASPSVIETMHAKMEFTVHVRGVTTPIGEYTAEAVLYYDDRTNPQDRRSTPFSIASQA